MRNSIEKYANSAQFFTPDVCFADARKYLPALFAKRNLPVDEAIAVLEELTNFIAAVDVSLYEIYAVEAKQRITMRDIDDWPIVNENLPGSQQLREAIAKKWIIIQQVEDRALVKLLRRDLDRGEL